MNGSVKACVKRLEQKKEMNMAEQFEGNWNLKDLLSDLIGATAPAAPTPRAEVWASDIGKPYVDRWLQMKGTPYSNPPNGADLLTFMLGKQIETGLAQMLTRCGIAFRSQEKLRIQPEGCLPVVGRPDLVAEVTDWQKVKDAASNRLPDEGYVSAAQRQALQRLLADWQERCPDGLPMMVLRSRASTRRLLGITRATAVLATPIPITGCSCIPTFAG